MHSLFDLKVLGKLKNSLIKNYFEALLLAKNKLASE